MRHHKANIVVKYRGAKRVRVGATNVTVRVLSQAEIDEVATRIESVRKARLLKPEPQVPTKICRGCEMPFPRISAYFNCRVRKDHSPYWYPYCRACKDQNRDRKRKAKAAP